MARIQNGWNEEEASNSNPNRERSKQEWGRWRKEEVNTQLEHRVTRISSEAEKGNCGASAEIQVVRATFLLMFWIRNTRDRKGHSGSYVGIDHDWAFHTERRDGEAGRGM